LSASAQALLDYGKYYRVWPFFDTRNNKLYVSVGLLRPLVRPVCQLFQSTDYGQTLNQIADFHLLDKRGTTTGQPFVADNGDIFVPIWNSGFYTHGQTWLAIFKSEDEGGSWEKVYEDYQSTYGKHFFQNPTNHDLYLGVGVNGGGRNNKVTSTPANAYLLRTQDDGKTWRKMLQVNYPTALYSGAVSNDNVTIVTAREKKSVFTSLNDGLSWTEKYLGNTARNVSYFKELNRFVVSSNSSIFVSSDGFSWHRINTPIKWIVLRYPTLRKGKIYFSSVVGRSFILSTDFEKWYINFDATKVAGSTLFSRMAAADKFFFLGNELYGILLRADIPLDDGRPIGTLELLKTNVKTSVSMARFLGWNLLTKNVLMF
jgi:Ca2+-binding RTX toxin-like protein